MQVKDSPANLVVIDAEIDKFEAIMDRLTGRLMGVSLDVVVEVAISVYVTVSRRAGLEKD
jgi:6,7-dimethyl-8-ribityllumazine synthase